MNKNDNDIYPMFCPPISQIRVSLLSLVASISLPHQLWMPVLLCNSKILECVHSDYLPTSCYCTVLGR